MGNTNINIGSSHFIYKWKCELKFEYFDIRLLNEIEGVAVMLSIKYWLIWNLNCWNFTKPVGSIDNLNLHIFLNLKE